MNLKGCTTLIKKIWTKKGRENKWGKTGARLDVAKKKKKIWRKEEKRYEEENFQFMCA
jgi:hypothetical protein